MAVYQCHEILTAERINYDMNYRERREILFFLKIKDGLFQGVCNATSDLVPELPACILHILDFRKQNLIKLADLKLDDIETLRLKGDQFHSVARDMENGLCLGSVLERQRSVELVGKRNRFEFQIDRVQVRGQQGI